MFRIFPCRQPAPASQPKTYPVLVTRLVAHQCRYCQDTKTIPCQPCHGLGSIIRDGSRQRCGPCGGVGSVTCPHCPHL